MKLNDLDQMRSPIDEEEVIPSTMFYRTKGQKRAKASRIREGRRTSNLDENSLGEEETGEKFGTFSGVFIRCILSILSAVYYLRLGWVVGNCGLVFALLLIAASGLATVLTTLSLSAVVSNGLVKGGGVYYFISRSLGSCWGGTVGVVFSFATTFGAVLHVFSFVDVIKDFIGHDITEGGKYDYPTIGIPVTFVLVLIICISLRFESYIEYLYTACIIAAMIGFFFGPCLPSSPRLTIQNIKNNLWAQYLPGETFWTCFAVFFPGCTGIMAGANISGDLEDPQKSIPIGTLGAIGVTTLLNMITAIILAAAGDRQTLQTDFTIMSKMSLWGPLVSMGIIGAALSSASAALIGGPKTFQSLCKDRLLPNIFDFFSVGKEKTNDPVRGFILAFIITAICCFCFNDLNTVGSVLTNFFLISFALICMSCFVGSMSKSPSWRPSWRWHHPILDVLGAVVMVVGMFFIDWIFSLVTVILCAIIYIYFNWKNTNCNWGEFTQSLLYTDTVVSINKLAKMPEHVKTYRPTIEYVVLTNRGEVESQITNMRPFQHINTQAYSLLGMSVIGAANVGEDSAEDVYLHYWGGASPKEVPLWIARCIGLGKLSPNVLATSFFNDSELYDIIAASVDANLGVMISRGFETFDTHVKNEWPIDIWWMIDDGGLTVLIGYLLSTHEAWKSCTLRVMTIATDTQSISASTIKLTKLLHLFRIPAEIVVVTEFEQDPSEATYSQWSEFISSDGKEHPDVEPKEIAKFMRLRELMKDRSGNSAMVISSLFLPKVTFEKQVWVSLVDFISYSMPPFIWVHGNNENVITFSA